MTAEEHYAEAEELLSLGEDNVPDLYQDKLIARAQVHATLACAAALLGNGDRGSQTRPQPRTEPEIDSGTREEPAQPVTDYDAGFGGQDITYEREPCPLSSKFPRHIPGILTGCTCEVPDA